MNKQKHTQKALFVAISLFLLLTMIGGTTMAYLSTRGETVTNNFIPGNVQCVVRNDYSVENKSNTPVYVRAAIIVNWENARGEIHGIAPVEGADYKIILGNGWSFNTADGYYYYNKALSVSGTAQVSAPVVMDVEQKTTNSGFALEVDILAEAIQAEGMDVSSAVQAWTKAQSTLVGN